MVDMKISYLLILIIPSAIIIGFYKNKNGDMLMNPLFPLNEEAVEKLANS